MEINEAGYGEKYFGRVYHRPAIYFKFRGRGGGGRDIINSGITARLILPPPPFPLSRFDNIRPSLSPRPIHPPTHRHASPLTKMRSRRRREFIFYPRCRVLFHAKRYHEKERLVNKLSVAGPPPPIIYEAGGAAEST